ncbi:MAG: hypothetical protein OEZ14_16675, partial [Acidimicrobiia bacterium]|nr:hypothetical protein [Acidimicrobiia bacterium]
MTHVRVGSLSSVDDRFAYDEGEGDRTREYWLDAHTNYFQRVLPELGIDFDADMATIFQRFDVPYQEDWQGSPIVSAAAIRFWLSAVRPTHRAGQHQRLRARIPTPHRQCRSRFVTAAWHPGDRLVAGSRSRRSRVEGSATPAGLPAPASRSCARRVSEARCGSNSSALVARNDILWADFGPPAGRRPLCVLTRNAAIEVLTSVTCAPIPRPI